MRALSHLLGRGAGGRPPPTHAQWDMADRQTAKKQEDRTAWMMFTRTQEKESEQERQPLKAG